jgi:hypothetical protein
LPDTPTSVCLLGITTRGPTGSVWDVVVMEVGSWDRKLASETEGIMVILNGRRRVRGKRLFYNEDLMNKARGEAR